MNDFSVQKSFSFASYLSSFMSAMGGAMTLNDLAIALGIVLALLTFGINWLYQAAKDRRDARQEEREQLLNQLETELARAQLASLSRANYTKTANNTGSHGQNSIRRAASGAAE